MKKTLRLSALLALSVNAFSQTDSVVFSFTGGIQSFTVPACVSSITIKAFGAQGAQGGGMTGGAGGFGAYIKGDRTVLPGEVYTIKVGGSGTITAGGYNGGGDGGSVGSDGKGGGGGGATSIYDSNLNLIAIAGGGGGGGGIGCDVVANGGNGGAGGGENGSNGADAPTTSGVAGAGFGAIGSAGGLKGIGCSGFLGVDGTAGSSFQGGNGGNGQSCCCFNAHTDPSGGGGGGGFIGGGGGGGGSAGTTGCSGNDKGAGGGGAGGTNALGTLTSTLAVNGVQSGDGKLVIVYHYIVPVVYAFQTGYCSSDPGFLLTYGTPSGGTWSGDGVSSNVFNPSTAGVGTHTLTYSIPSCSMSPTTSVEVRVFTCTGITDIGAIENAISIFPNPIVDKMNIETTESFGLSHIKIFDMEGKLVFESSPSEETKVTIDMNQLSKGSYMIELEGKRGKARKSFNKM